MIILSIITVVKNDKVGLQNTIGSINSWAAKISGRYYIEHIIKDGNSDDGTLEYLESLEKKIGVIRSYISSPDKGIYDAMNASIPLSNGLFVNYLNAGDVIHPESNPNFLIDDLLKCATEKNLAGLACSAIINFNNRLHINIKPKIVSPSNLRMPSVHQSMFYKNTILNEYEYSIDYKICGDFEHACRIISDNLIFLRSGIVFSVFGSDGISSLRPLLLFKESFFISNKFSNEGWVLRLLTISRLFFSISIFQILKFLSR